MNVHLKVQPHHLERGAYLYIRHSSMRQVVENVESARRQHRGSRRRGATGIVIAGPPSSPRPNTPIGMRFKADCGRSTRHPAYDRAVRPRLPVSSGKASCC